MIGVTYIVVMLFTIHIFPDWFSPSIEESRKEIIHIYKQKEFKGVVKIKYIDSMEHLYKKIVINQKGIDSIEIFNSWVDNIFNLIQLGDIVEKRKGDLFVKVKRGQLDTLIYFDLGFDVEKFERELQEKHFDQ